MVPEHLVRVCMRSDLEKRVVEQLPVIVWICHQDLSYEEKSGWHIEPPMHFDYLAASRQTLGTLRVIGSNVERHSNIPSAGLDTDRPRQSFILVLGHEPLSRILYGLILLSILSRARL